MTAAAMTTYDCAPAGGDAAAQEQELARIRAETRWVDSVYASLTPRQRVAQLSIPHLVISDNAAGRAKIKKYVGDDGVGGLLLGKGDIAAYAALNSYAQSLARVPLMITADAEWGLSMRLNDAPRFPHNIALGATSDTAAIAAYGREMARECLRLGITVSFAPVADVNSNPDNPVIGYRSFGEDPERVAALSLAYARGLEEGGVMSVGKHFPGHGDTSADSHKTLPVVSRSEDGLRKVELVPFRALVDGGMSGIMVGHMKVPALDASGTPASLSGPVVRGLLKNRMKFDGLVFTDALEMAGAQVKGANNCVLALRAGADVLLGSGNPSSDIDAVMKAISTGRLRQKEVDTSVRKVLCYKYRLGLTAPQTVVTADASRDINSEEARGVARRLARAAITVVRDSTGLLPLHGSSKVLITGIGGLSGSDGFVNAARQHCGSVTVVSSLTPQAVSGVDAVIVPVSSSDAAAVGRLASLRRIAGDKLVPVFFISPYKMAPFAKALRGLPTLVLGGDDTPELRCAAADAVFGTEDADGRMAVNVTGVARVGEGVSLRSERLGRALPVSVGAPPRMAAAIDSLIDCGLARKAFTGCQVMVVKDGEIIFDRSSGTLDGDGSARVTSQSLFDLASVSKVAGTLVGLMAAYDRGMFRLDDTLDKFIPELCGDPKGRLTMRSLMLHETGMPASLNTAKIVTDPESLGGTTIYASRRDDRHTISYDGLWGNNGARLRNDLYRATEHGAFELPVARGVYATPAARDTIVERIFALQPNPSKAYRYSDLNFILLMEAEERITGRNHDEWVDETVYAPLGIQRLTYRPLDLFELNEIVATENDPFLRKQKIHGYVHDETAAFMGGVAGSAGLFGNTESLAVLCGMLTDGGRYDGRQVFSKATVDAFLSPRSSNGRRGLGFDTAADGRFLGHTGFTGTCIWFDPGRDLIVIVLTNRVNPSRDNRQWNALKLRTRILDVVDSAFPRT